MEGEKKKGQQDAKKGLKKETVIVLKAEKKRAESVKRRRMKGEKTVLKAVKKREQR